MAMTRRGFLRAFLAFAAAPAIGKIADAFNGPELSDEIAWVNDARSGEWTVIDLRAKAREELVKWYGKTVDKLFYEHLAGVAFTPS